MRRTIAIATTPGRWRRRRTARMAVAAALVVAAPFVGRPDGDPAHADGGVSSPDATSSSPASSGPAPSATSADGSRHEAMRVVPVPLADPAVADVLSPGDLVDLVAVAGPAPDPAAPGSGGPGGGDQGGGPVLAARAAQVRDIPAGRPGARSILVEVPESAAPDLAATAATTPLAVIVHG